MWNRPVFLRAVGVLLATVGLARAADAPPVHFHPKGKAPSRHTVELQQQARAQLPFEDQREFQESRRGFVAAPAYREIKAADGHVVWNMASFDFLQQGRQFDSIHPSLQRQAVLNMGYGLYEVVPGRIYQVRGFDISNISFVKGDTGWIVFDPLLSSETAAAALAFVNEQLGQRPVVAVVYSHSHVDHFGGVRGVIDEADVRSGQVPVIAPAGFQQEAVAENLHVANAMVRRAYYQYGLLLPRSPYGYVDQAIGKTASTGSTGLIAPTRSIAADIEEVTIDGVTMVFQNTPGSEAPVEMNTWFPQFKAFWAAENITGTIHNIYTLRGALIRDPLAWSKHINTALYAFGQHAEVMFASHNWPRWGSERIKEVMRVQRDVYANLHNDVMHAANSGVTINQIHNVYRLPESLQRHWAARSYHGSEAHNSRGVINRYLGYWDGNPATLIPLSPEQSAPLYVEMMGGADRILARARTLVDDGEYLLATEILNKLVNAEPDNQPAKDLLADAFEQVGYGQESASLRNSFLAAALELRSGIPAGLVPRTATPDTMRAMSTGLWLDYLGILVDSRKAAGVRFVANLVTPDNGEQYVLEMSNATLTNIAGFRSPAADVTITLDRVDLEQVMMRKETFRSLAFKGRAKFDGNAKALEPLAGTFGAFDPFFEIMPGTKQAGATAQ